MPRRSPLAACSSALPTAVAAQRRAAAAASIVAREMGLNAVVGTHNGTDVLQSITDATIYCAGGETGTVYRNQLRYHVDQVEVSQTKQLPVKLMMNVGNRD